MSLDSIITMDMSGTIQSASDDVEALLGWSASELCGRSVTTLIPEPKRSALDRFLDRYRNPGRAVVSERARRFDALSKSGKVVPIELSVSRADLPGQAEPYFVGLLRDVSRQIDVSAESPERRTRLQQFIAEQTRLLAAAQLRLQLSDRLASLGTLAAGLGHDLNNVLLPLRARLNAIEHAGIPKSAMHHIEGVRQALTYLQHLSDGLHVLSIDPRAEGDDDDATVPTDLALWWKQVGPLLRTSVPRHVRVRASLSEKLPSVAIAPHLLTQAALNIIVNAGEAIPERSSKGRVLLSARLVGGERQVRLSISDNGRGMTAEVRKRALDPFFTSKPRATGTGLGLPIAKKAIERVGGRLEIQSTRGTGTTIGVLLPVAGSQPPAEALRRRGHLVAAVTHLRRDTAMLASQMLAAGGFRILPSATRVPGTVDLWLTTPVASALAQAERWTKTARRRRILLFGAPNQRSLRSWANLGAVVLSDEGDLRELRLAIANAAVELRAALTPRKKR